MEHTKIRTLETQAEVRGGSFRASILLVLALVAPRARALATPRALAKVRQHFAEKFSRPPAPGKLILVRHGAGRRLDTPTHTHTHTHTFSLSKVPRRVARCVLWRVFSQVARTALGVLERAATGII